MNETEELELNQWCHAFLERGCWHEPERAIHGFLYVWRCRLCKVPKTILRGLDNPSYTSSLDLAAIVEAKAIETAGWQKYDDALIEVLKSEMQQAGITANAITRCRGLLCGGGVQLVA